MESDESRSHMAIRAMRPSLYLLVASIRGRPLFGISSLCSCMNEERTNREGGNEGGTTIRHTGVYMYIVHVYLYSPHGQGCTDIMQHTYSIYNVHTLYLTSFVMKISPNSL